MIDGARMLSPRTLRFALEALADKSLPRNGPGRANNGNFALGDFRISVSPTNGGEENRTEIELKR